MFKKIDYRHLSSRQQENYNFQKLAGRLADYGYTCIKLSDDWQGADFIACHVNGEDFLKVQLKGRLTIDGKYIGKNIYIGYMADDTAYVYPHDTVMEKIMEQSTVGTSDSWTAKKSYSWPKPPAWALELIEEYEV